MFNQFCLFIIRYIVIIIINRNGLFHAFMGDIIRSMPFVFTMIVVTYLDLLYLTIIRSLNMLNIIVESADVRDKI